MRAKMGIKLTAACIMSLALILLTSALVQLPAMADVQRQDPVPAGEGVECQSDLCLADLQPEGWTAGETSVSRLSEEERAALVGVPLEVLDWEQGQIAQAPPRLSASYSYPSTLDWRDFEGGDWTTPIRNQAGCASCVAFGTIGTIESRLEISTGDPNLNPDLSESHLFFCGGGNCTYGWWPEGALDFARDTGIVDEACYPYTDQQQTCAPCADWEDRVTQISSWVDMWILDELKQELADNGPVEVVMMIYNDFYYYTGGVYEHTSGAFAGLHAVTIVGYNDPEGYWIAKNSWGTDWGEDGWFRIAYGECDIDSYFYVPIMPEPSYTLTTSVTPEGSGTVITDPLSCSGDTCASGAEVELTAIPEPGYEFLAWSGDASGSDNPITIILDSDKCVTASFGNDAGPNTTAVTLSSFSAHTVDSSPISSIGVPAVVLAGLMLLSTALAWDRIR
jgi:C1A family cysteine protease